jgi:membrane-anchored mycosin MYCP
MLTVRRLCATGLLLTAAATVAVLPAALPAWARAECQSGAAPGQVISQAAPEQLTLAARRAWPTTTGQGVTVAVIDTGVDRGHPQLTGAVLSGWDLTRNTAGGDVDCTSHGTAVAGLVAARPHSGVGFVGIAERPTGSADSIGAGVLAKGIRWATDHGARVINTSLGADRGSVELLAAVRYAEDHDVLLVASAGVRAAGAAAADATTVDPPSYPASYPGVLSVGAVDRDGMRFASAPLRPDIALVAPGSEVLSATRVQGHAYWSGSDVATALVSGTAALVRAAYPRLSAAEVRRRLMATANPVPGGSGSPAYGQGMVDPYRAVTEVLSVGVDAPVAQLPAYAVDEGARRRAAHWTAMGLVAMTLAIVLAGIVTATGIALVMRRKMATRTPATSGAPATGLAGSGDARLVDLAELYYTTPKPPRPGDRDGSAS